MHTHRLICILIRETNGEVPYSAKFSRHKLLLRFLRIDLQPQKKFEKCLPCSSRFQTHLAEYQYSFECVLGRPHEIICHFENRELCSLRRNKQSVALQLKYIRLVKPQMKPVSVVVCNPLCCSALVSHLLS